MFKEFDLKNYEKLNFKEENKAFFIDNFRNVSSYIDKAKAFYYEENSIVLGVFIITYLNKNSIQIAFYVIDPGLDEEKSLSLINEFLDFLDNFSKKEGIKEIFAGVNYYNDELFELMLEKGFSAISYKMYKRLED